MGVRCSRCHTEFALDEGGEHACPTCNAEAGLEPVKGVPGAMRAFGVILGAVIVATLAGNLVSFFSG